MGPAIANNTGAIASEMLTFASSCSLAFRSRITRTATGEAIGANDQDLGLVPNSGRVQMLGVGLVTCNATAPSRGWEAEAELIDAS